MSETQAVDYDGPYGEASEADVVKVDLYDANKGKAPRTGGPYQDEEVAKVAEERRAALEDREPDYDNLPATAATVLVPEQYLVERDNDKSHYSDAVKVTNEPVDSVIVEKPVTEPDPNQGAWDNNMDNVNALEGQVRLERAKAELAELQGSTQPVEEVPTSSPETETKPDDSENETH